MVIMGVRGSVKTWSGKSKEGTKGVGETRQILSASTTKEVQELGGEEERDLVCDPFITLGAHGGIWVIGGVIGYIRMSLLILRR